MKNNNQLKTKNSGVEWIGNIPQDWNIQRLKSIIQTTKNGAWGNDPKENDNDIVCIRVADFDKENFGINIDNLTTRNIDDYEKLLLEKDDLILEKSGGGDLQLVGRVVLFNQDIKAVTSNFLSTIRLKKEIANPRFFYYLLKYYYDSSINHKSIKQTTGIQNIDSDSYFQEPISVPNLIIQKNIANYLDIKTDQIKTFIKNKKKLIILLEEQKKTIIYDAITKGLDKNVKIKPSGVEWLGGIPENWEIKKLKYVSTTRVSNVDKKSEDDNKVQLCNYVDVYKNEYITYDLDFMNATATKDQIEKFQLKKGDVIITKDSETADDIGIPAYVDIDDNKDIVCGYHLAIITPNNSVLLGKYLFRLLETKLLRAYFEVNSNGVTRYGLDIYSILNTSIILPPIPVQKVVIEYLDIEISKINKIIKTIKQEVELIEEYKKSLIYHAVTGKIEKLLND